MDNVLYIPDVLQYSDFDCGDMCAQAVMAYYGTDINEIKLLKKLKTRKKDGTGSEHLVEFFKKNKFKVDARSMDIADLISFIKKKIPVIVLAQAWKKSKVRYQRTKSFGHYMIVIGFDEKKLYFEDPAMFGRGYIPIKEFIKRWHALDKDEVKRFGIAVWGKKPYDYDKFVRIK
jgi:ABC-type bacteriocin/lantibiotic exporter with double-glycine peptidase domain